MAHDFRADRAGYRKMGGSNTPDGLLLSALRTCRVQRQDASTSREPPPNWGWSPFSTGPLSEDGSTSRQIAWAFCSASAQPGSSLRSRFHVSGLARETLQHGGRSCHRAIDHCLRRSAAVTNKTFYAAQNIKQRENQ